MPGPTGFNPLVNTFGLTPEQLGYLQVVHRTDCACCGNCRPSSWGRWTYQYRENPLQPGFVGGLPPSPPDHPGGLNARELVELRGGNPWVHIYGATGGLENFQDTYIRLGGGSVEDTSTFIQYNQYPSGPPPHQDQAVVSSSFVRQPGLQIAPSIREYLTTQGGIPPEMIDNQGPASVGNQGIYRFAPNFFTTAVPRITLDNRKPTGISGPVWCWSNDPQGINNTTYNGGLVMGQDATQEPGGDHPSNPDEPVVLSTVPTGKLQLFNWGPPVTINPYTTPTTNQEILALNAGPNPWQTTKLTVALGAPLGGEAFIDFRSGDSPVDALYRFFAQCQLSPYNGLKATPSGIPQYIAANVFSECVPAGTWEVPALGFVNGLPAYFQPHDGLIVFGPFSSIPKNQTADAPKDGYENHIPLASMDRVLNSINGTPSASIPLGFPIIPSFYKLGAPCFGPGVRPAAGGNGHMWIKGVPVGPNTYSLRMYVYELDSNLFFPPGTPLDPSTTVEFLGVSAPIIWTVPASPAGLSWDFGGWSFQNESDLFGNWAANGPGGAGGPKLWTNIVVTTVGP